MVLMIVNDDNNYQSIINQLSINYHALVTLIKRVLVSVIHSARLLNVVVNYVVQMKCRVSLVSLPSLWYMILRDSVRKC